MTRDATTAFARTLVDEWVRQGLDRRLPGSGIPLGAARPRARRRRPASACTCTSTSGRRRSSRSASAAATGVPAILLCTSGTAAANFHPAVLEAPSRARAADRGDRRPPARAAGHRRGPDRRPGEALRRRRALVSATRGRRTTVRVWAPSGGPARPGRSTRRSARLPGPVHLNLPFREPLVPTGAPLVDAPGRSHGRPWTARAPAERVAVGRDGRRPSRTSCRRRRGARARRVGRRSRAVHAAGVRRGRGLAGARRPDLEPARARDDLDLRPAAA